MRRKVRWRGLESGSTEVCWIEETTGGVRASGEVRGARSIDYEVRLSGEWEFSELEVHLDGGSGIDLRLVDGRWLLSGVLRPDLAEARDIDLFFSPLTNTLPIRRLALQVGESADIVTAYVSPDFEVVSDPQRYTRLDVRTFLYESRDSDFSRQVTVDRGGVVVDYPGLFRRLTD